MVVNIYGRPHSRGTCLNAYDLFAHIRVLGEFLFHNMKRDNISLGKAKQKCLISALTDVLATRVVLNVMQAGLLL